MNDFVLRGFCQNPLCNKVLYFGTQFQEKHKEHKDVFEYSIFSDSKGQTKIGDFT